MQKHLSLLTLLTILVISFSACKMHEGPDAWQFGPFVKVDSVNPVLLPDSTPLFLDPIWNKEIAWEAKDVFNPAAIVRNDTLFLLYRAEDKVGKYAGVSRIGLAWSTDGYHFTKLPTPVLYPSNDPQKIYEWEGGCEDPRIVVDNKGTYYLTYTAYDGDLARLMVASSTDLRNWKKHGHAFAKAEGGRYVDSWSKSGSIVADYADGNPVAVTINGHYWMYWGDTDIFLASSEDLINWTPVTVKDTMIKVFMPRKGKFDSDLVEPGPAAMKTPDGIILIYNSRNVPSKGDSSLPEGTYTAGQVMLDRVDPSHVIRRSRNYFLKPDKPYEITGQVNHVCFIEGLVQYKGKWFMYYGTADSKIAVAVKE
ncbi:MAG TPA: glycoside hydrolase family 130 protein [Chitinophagaceae bacterium]|nr:glycoside hydrolase family 130 protein [Chitinophagaceae bacterium]